MQDYFQFKEISELFADGQFEKARHLLLEMQSRCIALRDELKVLRSRLQSLEEVLHLDRSMFLENGFYWLQLNGMRHGPYCPCCHDRDGSLVRLQKGQDVQFCPYCQAIFSICPCEKKAEPPKGRARILYFAR